MYQTNTLYLMCKKDLSTRQIEILQLLSKGFQNAEIADRLQPPITEGGVKQHLHRIYNLLQVNNRIEAVIKFKELEK
ncbi:MAG: LuxR C-terminal-related transcriptional regulator [Bacteroidota bacterium]